MHIERLFLDVLVVDLQVVAFNSAHSMNMQGESMYTISMDAQDEAVFAIISKNVQDRPPNYLIV